MEKVTIAGAGLVGSLTALFMSQKGFNVDLYEKRPDPRIKGYLGGRSINLALSDRGWKALEKVGMKERIQNIALPMKGRMMHNLQGQLTFQAYGKDGQNIYSVPRGDLNIALLEEADKNPNVNLIFNKKLQDLNFKEKQLVFKDYEKNKELIQVPYEVLIGTDGVFSAVRFELQRTPGFSFSQQYISHGYKELTMTANQDGSHKMDTNALHIWPRGNFMLIALPNHDGTFTCTLFLPFSGAVSFEQLDTEDKFEQFFKTQFKDAYDLIPDVKTDYHANPTSSLVYVMADPWHYENSVLLLGDAAHGVVPFYGQGMNSGFEDCTMLDMIMDEEQNNWTNVLKRFSKERVNNAKAISKLALQNFIEMRDDVGDVSFLLRKKIERFLHEQFPKLWIPQYSMVTFSHIPYSEALAKGEKQRAIMDDVMKIKKIEGFFEDQKIKDEVLTLVKQKLD